ncbi:MAG: MBOAT family protein [Oscillospiraceae bacterium]|nr:MBOAT family protein [Oscillospiraceae bacterium]
MVFSHLIFIYAFLPLLMILYYVRRNNAWRRGVLLAFSLVFYAWGEPVYILLMLGSAALNYLFGICIGASETDRGKKLAVVGGVVANLLILGVFKYTGFAVETVNALLGLAIPVPKISLPLGISFYTFQAMTYVIDVYRGYCPPQGKFSRVLLYICLFPQLVAGPIVRYTDVQDQLADRRVGAAQINAGVYRFAIGLGKKVIFSNTCGLACQNMFASAGTTVAGNWLAILFYALQIYFDFSGYSDMAIGLGHMFGFTFPENFDYPYISSSITEYWRRWHMTLGSWFRDYLFYPVLRSKALTRLTRWLKKSGHKAASRNVPTILALLVVWFSTGLWHGAAWNYVLWGLYYGFWLILEKYVLDKQLKKLQPMTARIIGHVSFVFITLIGYALFYHEKNLFANLGLLFGIGAQSFSNAYAGSLLYENGILLIVSLICVTPLGHYLFDKFRELTRRAVGVHTAYAVDRVIKTLIVVFLLAVCTLRLVGDSYNPFIYFKF